MPFKGILKAVTRRPSQGLLKVFKKACKKALKWIQRAFKKASSLKGLWKAFKRAFKNIEKAFKRLLNRLQKVFKRPAQGLYKTSKRPVQGLQKAFALYHITFSLECHTVLQHGGLSTGDSLLAHDFKLCHFNICLPHQGGTHHMDSRKNTLVNDITRRTWVVKEGTILRSKTWDVEGGLFWLFVIVLRIPGDDIYRNHPVYVHWFRATTVIGQSWWVEAPKISIRAWPQRPGRDLKEKGTIWSKAPSNGL